MSVNIIAKMCLHGPYLLSPGCIENPRSSVIGLFRRESTSSTHMSSCESSPGSGHPRNQKSEEETQQQTSCHVQHPQQYSRQSSSSHGPSAVILIEEREADPLGVLQPPVPTSSAQITPTTTSVLGTMSLPRPTTARRGSMLELGPSGSVSVQLDQNNEHNSI